MLCYQSRECHHTLGVGLRANQAGCDAFQLRVEVSHTEDTTTIRLASL